MSVCMNLIVLRKVIRFCLNFEQLEKAALNHGVRTRSARLHTKLPTFYVHGRWIAWPDYILIAKRKISLGELLEF